MSKPKKPLRGLFASTEQPAKVPVKNPPPVPMPSREGPRDPHVPAKPKLPSERLAPPPRVKPTTPSFIMEEHTPSPEVSLEALAAPIVVSLEPLPAPTVSNDGELRIMNVQYNFDAMKTVRESWLEQDYATFLKRLDQLQTEAFILRGKLLSEAKLRFFETNKQGWIEFCDATLGMNYTTANQYIRVASEFDVTSHHRRDFGFEHFKAMLPLSIEERIVFIEGGESWSVKSIRNKVKEILKSKPHDSSAHASKESHRQSLRFIRSLQTLKSEMAVHSESFKSLSETQRWQISAACQNIAAHLNHLARTLNDAPVLEPQGFSTPTRAGAFGTVDGVAQMEDILSAKDSTDNQFKN